MTLPHKAGDGSLNYWSCLLTVTREDNYLLISSHDTVSPGLIMAEIRMSMSCHVSMPTPEWAIPTLIIIVRYLNKILNSACPQVSNSVWVMELRLLRAEVTDMETFIFSQANIFYSLKRPKDNSFQCFSHVSHQQVFFFYKAILLWAWILFRIRDRWNGYLDPTWEYGYFLLNT